VEGKRKGKKGRDIGEERRGRGEGEGKVCFIGFRGMDAPVYRLSL